MYDEQEKLSTEMLLSKILTTKSVENFISNKNINLNIPTLAEHLYELCVQKGIKPRDVIKEADIDRFYGANIFSGKRKNPHRDYIIRLAFGLKLNYDECQNLLVVSRECKLYPRISRDALIIRCLHDRLTYQQTQERLYDAGMSILGEKCE